MGGSIFGKRDYPGWRNKHKQFFGYWADTSPIPRVLTKGFTEGGTVGTWWGDKIKLKKRDIFCKKENTGAISKLEKVLCQGI